MTHSPSATTAVRLSAAIRAGTGIALLASPAAVEQLIAPPDEDPPTAVARLLGARLCVQSLVEGTLPRRTVTIGGTIVDLLHTASMIIVGVAEPRYRRVAAVSALMAATAAATSLHALPDLP